MSISTSKRLALSDDFTEDRLGAGTYQLAWEYDVSSEDYSGATVVSEARALVGSSRLPDRGENYNFGGTNDLGSFAQSFRAYRPDYKEHQKRWRVEVSFSPIDPSAPPDTLTEPDPLLWPVRYDIDWLEEQIPLDKALNVDDLSHIGRAELTMGPVVNGCGVEFTEGLMKTIFYPVLIATKNYATLDEIVALNLAYQGTMNNGTFFGSDARTAKYLTTESNGLQNIGGTEFYQGITRVIFKQATWDRPVLNNGWTHFQQEAEGVELILDAHGKPARFQNKVHDDPEALEEDSDTEASQPCSEPLNLLRIGTLLNSDDPAVYLTYRDLTEANYAGIGIGG